MLDKYKHSSSLYTFLHYPIHASFHVFFSCSSPRYTEQTCHHFFAFFPITHPPTPYPSRNLSPIYLWLPRPSPLHHHDHHYLDTACNDPQASVHSPPTSTCHPNPVSHLAAFACPSCPRLWHRCCLSVRTAACIPIVGGLCPWMGWYASFEAMFGGVTVAIGVRIREDSSSISV